jgi:hypothetical protein
MNRKMLSVICLYFPAQCIIGYIPEDFILSVLEVYDDE